MKKFYFLLLGLFLFSGVNAQVISFSDANFKGKLLGANSSNTIAKDLSGNYFKIDANGDNEIQVSEAMNVSYLDLRSSWITSLVGISNFSNLESLNSSENSTPSLDLSSLVKIKELYCDHSNISSLNINGLIDLKYFDCSNNHLSSLDVSGYTNLRNLSCDLNQMTSLNVSGTTNLYFLFCQYNQLTTLDITGLVNLGILSCYNNLLTSIDLTGQFNLSDFRCQNNQITSLNFTDLNNIFELNFAGNQISNVDLSNLTTLNNLDCSDNLLTSLDVSDSPSLSNLFCFNNQITSLDANNLVGGHLYCQNNKLTSLYIKNGINSDVDFSNNPTLQYICTDELEADWYESLITSYGYTNCFVSTYCSFVPGGTYYTIQGNHKYDENNNGCDIGDIIIPNLKFSLTDGATTGSIISNETGEYSIAVQTGTYTIAPVLENSSYFTVSPTTTAINFPSQPSPFTKDFCITANGVHPDLEINLIPTSVARPGFDTTYKIFYKNKGTASQSGSVSLVFNDAVLDFVSANPITTSQAVNNLSWDYTNLLPFETREITFKLNVNAPTDTPAVNSGDLLDFNTTITSPATDDTPTDNTFAMHQMVRNSLDPNDKTCLEGTTITPAMVGEYVHYVIRFENNGTANAQNIVVKDIIDTAKFDINTLIPIKGSHDFVTNITSGNKVEFIFENINLPFDDANNDGFVAFKIKTKSSLVAGDTFTNSANIYFDYNFPIVTNTATTTVQTLGTSDFEFAKYFKVYPNPAVNTLNLSTKSGISVNAIAIYNILGQLVIAIPNAQSVSNIDVSSLRTGNYFIKMTTDKGTSNTKFIKN